MKIGNIYLPDTFRVAMQNAVLYFIDIPRADRISRLVDEYSCFEKSELQSVLEHLGNFMGSYQAREALAALQNDDFEKVADLTLAYYDKLYENSLARRQNRNIIKVPLLSGSVEEHAAVILKCALEMGVNR
jgi:tRNA 2-selenouridine synthase